MEIKFEFYTFEKKNIMKDRTCRHYCDFVDGKQLELTSDDEKNVTFTIGDYHYEPVLQVKFTKESIQEVIEDLQNLIK